MAHTDNPTGQEDPGAEDADSADEAGDDKILSDAKSRLQLAEDAESDIRANALDDLKFRSGQQWPDSVKADRDRDGRPCLVINRIPQFIQQITNDQRQNRPAIKVHPVDDDADVETGKIIQGLVRHIEYNSNADTAYDTAFDGAATGGFGYFRIITDYASPKSFDQEILIKRIRNPFSVYFDPHAQEPDGSDASWAIIVEDHSKDEYLAKYPESELSSQIESNSLGNQSPSWIREDGSCRVAEYFYKEFKDVDIVLLSNGDVVEKEKLQDYAARILQANQGQPPQDIKIVDERKARVPIIRWCKINAVEVLEKTDWMGTYIPIVPVYGTELYVDGKRILEGVVRNAKDSQRMYNYWASAETEAIALAPRAPFIAAEGQLEGHEKQWETANRRNHAFLYYKPTSVGGQPMPPPQRNVFEPAVGAITNARMVAADDLKATTGIYDAALGAKSNENSGIAIQRRNAQSQTSNFHFIDNLTRSLRHTGRILVDLIPKVYDTARAARIIGDDGEQKVVKINQQFTDENGKPVLYQLDAGRYDVTVDVGPSFASKRQEAVASMLDVTKSYPQLAQVAGDLIVKSMDWPGAQEIADRLKKTLPPGLADDAAKGPAPVPPQIQAQMAHMGQMVEQLTAQLHKAHDALDMKAIELESHERIEFAKIKSNESIALAKIDSSESVALLKQDMAAVQHRLSLLAYDQPIQQDMGEQEPGPDQDPNQSFAPPQDGAQGAAPDQGAPEPTGGQTPGSPMEGNP